MFKGYGYKGRHRAQRSHTGRIAAASVGASALMLFSGPGTAHADPLGAIAQCESGGNPQASNGTHFGLYQFDMATWRSVGGTGHPLNASAAEQTARARALLASRGTQPWLASQSCWGGSNPVTIKRAPKHAAPKVAAPKVVHTAPRHAAPEKKVVAAAPSGKVHVVIEGDTLNGIATEYRISGGWQSLYEKNDGVIGSNPNLIFPGQKFAL